MLEVFYFTVVAPVFQKSMFYIEIYIYIYQDFGCRCVLVHEQIEVQGSNVDHSESYTLLTSVYIEQDERGLGLFVLLTVSFSRALSR